MERKQRRIGIILSYIAQLIQILTGLVYTPIMLRLLGQSEYGLYQLVYSVVSYLGLLSLGFNASYMRFYSRFKANHDEKGEAKLNGMFMIIFIVIAVICIICGIIMVVNINMLFGDGLTGEEFETARILLSIMVINLAITFPNSVFTCIVTSQEKFIFQKSVILLQSLLNPFLTLPLLILGYGSIGMVTVTTLLTLGVLMINMFYCFRRIHSRFYFKQLDFRLLKEMWHFTFFIFLNQIIDQINWCVDKFLLGRMVGVTSVAVYGIGGQLNTLYLQFSGSVSNVFVPKVNRIIAESGDSKELTQVFTKVGRIQFTVLMLILSGLYIFGKPFIYFWAGKGYEESYYVSLLLLTPVTIPLIQNLGIEIQRAKNKHQARSIVYFFIAVANIFISIPLIKIWGAVGAAIGTSVSLVMGNGVFMNWYYHFYIGLNMKFYWKSILSICKGLIAPLLAGIISYSYITYDNLFELSAGIVVYTMIYSLSVYYLGMNQEEKKLIIELISGVFKRFDRK